MLNKNYQFICLFLSCVLLSACTSRTIPAGNASSTNDTLPQNNTLSENPAVSGASNETGSGEADSSLASTVAKDPAESGSSVSHSLAVHAQAQAALPTLLTRKQSMQASLLACIENADAFNSRQLQAEIQRLEHAHSERFVARFAKACLLSRAQASEQEWDQAQRILAELSTQLQDDGERQLVRHLTQSINLQKQLRWHQAQLDRLRQQNSELQSKIEQLKGLEQELDMNNPYSSESEL